MITPSAANPTPDNALQAPSLTLAPVTVTDERIPALLAQLQAQTGRDLRHYQGAAPAAGPYGLDFWQAIADLLAEVQHCRARDAQLQFQADVLQQISEAVIAIDQEERVIYLNAAAAAQYEVDPVAAVGQPLSYLHQHEWLQPDDAVIAYATLAERGYWRGENRHIKRNGRVLHVESTVSLLRDEAGQEVGLLACVRDITARKQAEAALRASEARYRQLADAMPQLVWTANAAGIVDYYNIHIHDYDPAVWQGAYGFDWQRLLHPDDLEPTLAAWQAATHKENYTCEHRLQVADGSWRWHLTRAVRGRGADDGIRWYGTSTDIHEHRLAEEEMRRSQELLQAIVDISPTVIYVHDLMTLQNVFVSAQAATMLGYTAEEFRALGTALMQQLMHPADQVAIREHFNRLLAAPDGAVLEFEYRMQHKSGAWRWFLTRDTVFQRTIDGKPARVMGVAVEITERKQAEETLRASEAFSRTLLESSPDCVKVLDAEGRLLRMNGPGLCLMEIDDFAPLIGQAWEQLWPQDCGRLIRTALAAAHGGEQARFQGFCPTAKGTPKWWDVIVAPVQDEQGTTTHFIAASRDISKAKATDEALRRANARFERAERAANAFVFESDLISGQVVRSPNFTQVTGYPLAEVAPTAAGWQALIHPADQTRFGAQALLAGDRTAYSGEYRVRHKQGHYIWVQEQAMIERDDGGRPLAIIGTTLDITARKVTEEALRESEARLNTILQNLPVSVYMLTTDQRYLYVNRHYEQIAQISNAEIQGKSIHDIFAPETAAVLAANDQRALAAKAPLVLEEFAPQAGEMHTYASIKTPLFDANGEPYALIGISTDITERKQAEAALRQSEARFRSLFASMTQGVVYQDAQGQIIDVNPAAERILGLSLAQMQGRVSADPRWRAMRADGSPFPGEEHPAMVALRTGQIVQGVVMGVFNPLLNEERWLLVDAVPQCHPGEAQPYQVYALFSDFTERKRIEEALRASEARFRTLANTAPSMVWTAAPDGTITYANEQWFAYCGLTPEANARQWPQLVLHPDDFARCVTQWSDALETGEPYEIEVRNQRHDGVYRWFLTRATPLHDAEGRVTTWFGVTTDIDDRKQAELNQQFLLELDMQTRLLDEAGAILTTTAARLGHYLGVAHCTFNEIDVAADRGMVQAHWRRNPDLPELTGAYTLSSHVGTAIADALSAGHSVAVANVAGDPRTAALATLYRDAGVQSIARAPFNLKGALLAILAVADDRPRSWRPDEIRLLEEVIARIWPLVARARSEQALQRSAERLHLATEAGAVGIFDHDILTNATEVSELYTQITGYPREAVVTREAWLASVHPADRALVAAIWEESRATGASYYYECRLVRPDGALSWVEVNALVTQDETGRSVRITGAVRDITERKRAALHQQFLLDLSATLRTMTDAAAIQQTVVERLGHYLGASRCRFNAIDLAADKATLLAAWSQPGLPPPADITPLSAYATPAYITYAQNGRTVVVHDVTNDERAETAKAFLLASGFPATIRVPCLRAGQWVASLHVLQSTPRQWRADEVQLVESVVHHFWPLVEKAHAEEALRRSEEQLRQITDNLPGLISVVNAREEYEFVNQNYQRWLGLAPAQIIGQPIAAVIGDRAYQIAQPQLRRALAGATVTFENRLPKEQSAFMEVMTTFVPRRAADGCVTGCYVLAMDITARKQAEVALQQSNAILQGVLESTNDAIFVRDLAGRYLLVNTAGAAQVGLPKEAILGRNYRDLFSAAEVAAIDAEERAVFAQGQSVAVEQVTTHNGVTRHWHTLKMPLRNAAGVIVGLISSARDFSARKQAEEALRASEARFRHLADALPQVVWTCQADGAITYINDQWSAYSGMTLAETQAQGMWPALHPDDQATNRAQWRRALQSGEPYEGEVRLRRHDGAYRWFLERAIPVRSEGGEIQQWFGVSMDIEERKAAEARQRFLADLSETMAGIQDPADLLWSVAQRLGEFLGVARSFFMEADHGQGQVFIHRNYHHADLASLTGAYLLADSEPHHLAEQAAGRTLIIDDTQSHPTTAPRYATRYAPLQARATVMAPLLRNRQWVATLVVSDRTPHAWAAADVALIETVAERAWLAVENRRLFQETKTLLAQVQESQHFLQSIADTLPNLLYLYDLTAQRNVYANRHLGVLLGYTPAEVQAMGTAFLPALMHPDDWATVGDHIARLTTLADGATLTREYRMRHKDGEWRWLAGIETIFARTADGRAATILGVVQDITERKAMEEALRARETELRVITDNIPGLIGYVDHEERYRFVNAAYSAWYGRPRAAIVGHPMREVIGEALYATVQPYVARALQGELVRFEATLPYHDATRTIWASYVPNVDEQGVVHGFYALITDISERKVAEEALRQSEARARRQLAEIEAIYATAPVGLAVLDTELRYVRVNEQLAEINGIPAAEHIGRTGHTIIPAVMAAIEPLLRRVIESGLPLLDLEAVGETAAQPGVQRVWSESFYPLCDEAGRVIGINTVVQEITERKRQESHQQFLNALGLHLRLLSNVDAILAQVVSRLGAYLQAAGCRVNEIDLAGGQFTLQSDWAAADAPWAPTPTPGVYPLAELAPPAVLADLQAGCTVAVANTLTDPRTTPVAENYQTKHLYSFVGVPIFHQGQWRATLSVKGYGERQWRQDEIALVETVANQLTALLDKVRAEEALRASEERFRQTFAQAPVGVGQATLDGRIEMVNPAFCRILGYTEAELIGRSIADLSLPDDYTTEVTAVEQAQREKRPAFTIEKRYRRKDGSIIWANRTGAIVRDSQGHPLFGVAIIEEITDRKRAEETIRQQLAEIEAIYAMAPVGLCLVDRELRYVRINEMLAAMNRRPVAAQLGRTLQETGTAASYQLIAPFYQRVIESGEPLLNQEVHESDADPAQARDWLASYYPLKNGAGVVTGVNAVIVEITEHKRQERQLQELNATLEARVRERTSALEQANQELARSNRELEQFNYAAAHDLKSPLRGIQHLVQWISEDAADVLTPASQKHLTLLRGRVQRLEKLLDDMLAYSRIGRVRYAPEKVDIHLLVHNIIDLLAPPPGFTIAIPTPLPTLLTMRTPLETVFHNLLSNTIKHHHQPASGYVEIMAHDGGAWLEFTIKDNGPGIDPAFHKRIFGMFQTLQPRDRVEGSGVGLALVKKTIESYGGQITVESAVGQGATFRFTWPSTLESS